MDQKRGILLFDDLEKPILQPQRVKSLVPSSHSSGRAKNAPHEPSGLRTNFKTTSMAETIRTQEHSTMPPLDSDSPILEDWQPEKGGREKDFGPPPSNFNTWAVLLGAVLGVGVGVALYFAHMGPEVQKLVALPGNLFLRALQCLIVPMVFCVMTVVVAETVAMGRTSILRWRTALPYAITSILATVQGLILALIFTSSFKAQVTELAPPAKPSRAFNLTMLCANGLYMSLTANGTLACVESNSSNMANLFMASNKSIVDGPSIGVSTQLSLMDQLIAITDLMIPVNIFQSLANGSLLSIVLFSLPLGFAAAHSEGQENHVLRLVRQLRNIFLLMLNGLLSVTPIAVVFLMASAIAKFDSENISRVMTQIGLLFGAFLVGAASHVIIVLPSFLFAMTKVNPFSYIQHLFPAYVFAFGCASSMATLPVAIACIQRADISRTLAHIAMPFGTPVNLNACGLYYPLAVVFMANMDGLGNELTASRYAVLFFVSLLGCMGTAPVPNASLVYLLTLWKTCFPSQPLPTSFAFVVAADFIIDRVRTMVNVNGNAIVTRILADQIDEAFEIQAAQHV